MMNHQRKRSGKGEETRSHIIDASVELFLEKGYEKTTIREIGLKAGVLPGSMYNLFKNKDEVFAEVVSTALWESIHESKKYLSDDDLESTVSFPLFLQIYAASRSPHIAGLLSTVYKKWEIKDECLKSLIEWIKQTEEWDRVANLPCFMTRVHATLGSLASILECYELIPKKMELRSSMLIVGKVFSDLFEADGDLESKIDRMISIFENNEIRICGVTI